jgi:transposase-like protein
VPVPESHSLVGSIDRFDVGVVERHATPELVMKLGVQFHLGGLSLSNTVSVLEMFGVERTHQLFITGYTKLNHSQKTVTLQIRLVDETVIRSDGDQYWLYAAVDPESNEFSLYKP